MRHVFQAQPADGALAVVVVMVMVVMVMVVAKKRIGRLSFAKMQGVIT